LRILFRKGSSDEIAPVVLEEKVEYDDENDNEESLS